MSDDVRTIGDKYQMAVALCSRCQRREGLPAQPQYCRVLDFMGDRPSPTLCLACWCAVKEAVRAEIEFGLERQTRSAASQATGS